MRGSNCISAIAGVATASAATATEENGPYLNILPRNFVAATFKCRSTPTGTLPTDEDLYNSLGRGFNNSNMPAWISLTSQQRADMVAFIKTFSPRWKSDKPGDPIAVPAEPALSLQSIQHGKELFTKLECWKCHGAEGRGDGPSASTLTDSNDQPIRPYNFAAGSRFKCGATNHDLYKIFMTGLDGTPMPSFADVNQTGRRLGPGALLAHLTDYPEESGAHSLDEYQRGS